MARTRLSLFEAVQLPREGSRGWSVPLRECLILSCFAPWLLPGLNSHLELSAQAVITVSERCDECVIERFVATTIGRTSDPNGLVYGVPVHLAALEDSSLVLLTSRGGAPTVFDQTGVFRRHIGRRGQGPLEFIHPSHVLQVPGDSLLIMDAGNDRAVVIPSTGTERMVVGMPSIRGIDILRWPLAISVAEIRSPDRIAKPFHVLDFSSGRVSVRQSLGPQNRQFLPGQGLENWSVFAVDDSLFWAAGGPTYALELWSSESGRRMQLHRRMDGFDPDERVGLGNPGQPPSPHVIHSFQDGEGLIWVVLIVPRDDWQDAWKDIPIRQGAISLSQSEDLLHDLYQTQVDVIDPVRGSLVKSAVFPGLAFRSNFANNPQVTVYRIAESGQPTVEVWSLELVRPDNSPFR